MKNRVLLVDGGSRAVGGLQHALRLEDWQTEVAGDGGEALAVLAARPCDIVVADRHVSDMRGTDLLRQVEERFPGTVRMLLSPGPSDLPVSSVGSVHQLLRDPCDAVEFRRAARRGERLEQMLREERLRRMVERIRVLPSLPDLYVRIQRELASPDPSLARVGAIVARDPAMTARILQIVNSAAFGARVEIRDPVQAVTYLGTDALRSLVLTTKVFDKLRDEARAGLPFERLREHSYRTAVLARRIALLERCPREVVELVFTGALLHDVGQLVLAVHLGEPYRNVHELARTNAVALHVVETETFQVSHAEVGAYLLGLWGLDDALFETVLFHHRPADAPPGIALPLGIVAGADAIEHADAEDAIPDTDPGALRELLPDADERLARWKELLRGLDGLEPS